VCQSHPKNLSVPDQLLPAWQRKAYPQTWLSSVRAHSSWTSSGDKSVLQVLREKALGIDSGKGSTSVTIS